MVVDISISVFLYFCINNLNSSYIQTGADLGWFSAHNKEEAIEKVCQNLNMSAEEIKLTQGTLFTLTLWGT